jgi:hypothetical protein
VPQEAAERCEREGLCGRRIFANGFFFSTSQEMLAKIETRDDPSIKLFLSKGTRATQRAPPALE